MSSKKQRTHFQYSNINSCAPENWQTVKLEDVTSVLGDGLHGTPEYDDFGEFYFINGNNLVDGSISINDKTKRTSEKEYLKHAKPLNERTILVSINGTLGNVALYAGEKVVLGKSACYFNVLENVDKYFIKYVISNNDFQHYIHNLATGSTIKNVSLKLMRNYEFKLPSIAQQKAIASVLFSLDERIKLLRETNATLEAIAQALFKSWFVDFDPVYENQAANPATLAKKALENKEQAPSLPPEIQALFPATFTDSPQGPIPEGWSYSAISSVVEGLYDGPHATPPEATNGGIFLGIKNLTGTRLDLSDIRYISDQDWDKWTKRITPQQGDIVFSYEATLGFFALVPPKLRCCLGRRLALVRPLPEDGTPHFWFHQFVSVPFQQLLDKHTIQGATVNRIALKSFPSLPVLVPCIEVRKAFESIVEGIWANIHANQAKAQTLKDFRDTLLPRLISGQLRLPEAEQAIAALAD